MPFAPGDPWPDTTYPGGAVHEAWSGYVRLVVQAQIAAGSAFKLGQSGTDRLNSGNVLSQAGGLPLGDVEAQAQPSGLWVDLTCDLTDLEITLGASSSSAGMLTKAEAGTFTGTLYDPTGKYDPLNPSGPYALSGATRLVPGVPVQAFAEVIRDPRAATVQVTRIPLFTGTADRWEESWVQWEGERFAKLVATDETKRWVKYDKPEQPAQGAGDSTLTRLNRIKNLFSWPGSISQWGLSSVTLQSTTLAQSAWEMANRTADDELGYVFFIPSPPSATWTPSMILVSRETWNLRSPPSMHIGCAPEGTTDTYYDIAVDAQPAAFDALLHNTVNASRTGGALQSVSNAASVKRYGEQTMQRTDLGLADDAQVATWAQALVNAGSFPQTVLDHITLQPAVATPDAARTVGPWTAFVSVLQKAPVQSVVHVLWAGAGYDADLECRIVGMQNKITAEAWEVTWQTLPATVIPTTLSFHVGPHEQDRLDAGFLLAG